MKAKIFNNEEVQAIIAGMKTMFREVVRNAIYDPPVHSYKDWHKDGWYYPVATMIDENYKEEETQYDSKAVKPKFQVGQEIFVKETFAKWWNNSFVYKADITPEKVVSRWYLPQHMKQEQSRLTLRIKSVKVERLRDISEEDCLKEGIDFEHPTPCPAFYTDIWDKGGGFYDYLENSFCLNTPEESFKTFWNSTQKKQEHEWEANPWVFAYEFEIINLKK